MDAALAIHVFQRALTTGDREAVVRLVAELVPHETRENIIDLALVPALERVGHLWEEGRISLVELYGAGRAAEVATELLEPLPRVRPAGEARVAIAVLEDQHVLGKRLVAAHLRAGGVDLLDLGVGLTAPVLVAQALEARVDVLLVSTLMLRGALKVHDVVRRLRDAGSAMRVVVGGAPFRLDPELYLEVGADACGRSAGDALALVHRLGGEGA